MPRLSMFVPPDVLFKLDTYETLYATEPSEVVQTLARVQHVSTDPLDADTVSWLVRHSKLRQFPEPGLNGNALAATEHRRAHRPASSAVPHVYTVRDVARFLRMTTHTIRFYISTKQLEATKLPSGRFRIHQEALDAFMARVPGQPLQVTRVRTTEGHP